MMQRQRGLRPIRFFPAVLLLLGIGSGLRASFESDMEDCAMHCAQALRLTNQQDLAITSIAQDESYLLPLDGVYALLTQYLRSYARAVTLHTFRGEEQTLLRSMVRSGGIEYAPFGLTGQHIDSLILTGKYYLVDGKNDRVQVSIAVVGRDARTIFQSKEYTLVKSDCPPGLLRGVFDAIATEESWADVVYRGRILAKYLLLFNSPYNNLLLQPAEYRFESRHPYSLQWQIDIAKEVLATKFAVIFSNTAPATILLEPTGTLVFIRDGVERCIDNAVDGAPLLPEEFTEEYDSLRYLYAPAPAGAAIVQEKRPYTTVRDKRVRERIYEMFTVQYPALFSPFNYKALDSLFVDKQHPSILVGAKQMSDPRIGREVIRYAWYDKRKWLAGLLNGVVRKQRSFAVTTKVMGVLNDNLDPDRFWAVVLQKWKTKDRSGACVYEDDGFLIVNIDAADTNHIDFRVHYRLWFYLYQYDDRELGITRHEKLARDLDEYFVNSMGGIDRSLKMAMKDLIIEKTNYTPLQSDYKQVRAVNK
jgi:hypothetical protein